MSTKLLAILMGIFSGSLVSVFFLVRHSGVNTALDIPNDRSLHTEAVPRTGGVSIVLWTILGWVLSSKLIYPTPIFAEYDFLILAGVLLLFGVSILDDYLGHVPARIRLLMHCVVTILLLGAMRMGYASMDTLLGIALTMGLVFLGIWSINLYNFMDGMDGLAGTMGVVGFGALAVIGWQLGDSVYALGVASIAAATLGFLVWNLPPAKIFMGDSGSTFLGYMMISASLLGIERSLFHWWVPVLIFMPFWLDATYTLLSRLFRRQKVWEAHREHWYQRLVLAGYPVSRVLLWELLWMVACSLLAILLVKVGGYK